MTSKPVDASKISWLIDALVSGKSINLVEGKQPVTVLSVERVDTPDLEKQTVTSHFNVTILLPTEFTPIRGSITVTDEGKAQVPVHIRNALKGGA